MSDMVLLAGILILLPMTTPDPPQGKPNFTFGKQTYVHRYTKGNLLEFTPKAQSNLKKWTDMVSINDYPDARDGDGLAGKANAVLENYKAAKAVIVKTDSKPRTEKKPAEHLIVVLFPQPDFIEAAFARFVMNSGVGVSVVYSHRIYGKKAGDAMSKWLLQNGEKYEKELMAMPSVPKH
ncbi:MAG: hypothetical protein H7Y17_01870 [Chlorobia bacterium]|nr:hypothetical protein [Fimbriimonadaceae bacterium]